MPIFKALSQISFNSFFAIGLFTLTVFVFSCKRAPGIYFSEPQPPGGNDMLLFPESYLGDFKNESGSSTLSIFSDMLVEQTAYSEGILKSEMENISNIEKYSDTIAKHNNNLFKIRSTKDSVIIDFYNVDTVFRISNGSKLRIHNESLYLNNKTQDSLWLVSTLKLNGENLIYNPSLGFMADDTIDLSAFLINENENIGERTQSTRDLSIEELNVMLKNKQINNIYSRIKK